MHSDRSSEHHACANVYIKQILCASAKDRGVVCVFSIFKRGWECMWVYVCVYTHTHTHCTDGVLSHEPRGRDEASGGPEESRSTKSRHMYIRICVQSTHVYVYARRRGEILD